MCIWKSPEGQTRSCQQLLLDYTHARTRWDSQVEEGAGRTQAGRGELARAPPTEHGGHHSCHQCHHHWWGAGRRTAPPGEGLRSRQCRPSVGTYQVITEGLHSGLHNHVLHCRHLLLDGPFLHLAEQLQDDGRARKMKPQPAPSPSPPSHSAPTSRSTEGTHSPSEDKNTD